MDRFLPVTSKVIVTGKNMINRVGMKVRVALLGSWWELGELLDHVAANTSHELFGAPHGEEDGRRDDEPGPLPDLADHDARPMT